MVIGLHHKYTKNCGHGKALHRELFDFYVLQVSDGSVRIEVDEFDAVALYALPPPEKPMSEISRDDGDNGVAHRIAQRSVAQREAERSPVVAVREDGRVGFVRSEQHRVAYGLRSGELRCDRRWRDVDVVEQSRVGDVGLVVVTRNGRGSSRGYSHRVAYSVGNYDWRRRGERLVELRVKVCNLSVFVVADVECADAGGEQSRESYGKQRTELS